uniref:NADH dehydrogenase subunit 6 n=1 Tax=Frankliniella panamensis TaxID=748666 RepID=UPI0026E20E12|nr:NADH dehydrogenase subunit 6 [Frankliniella panamensis]WJO89742.1 NADH dehydrogenase subunit 6 [Frankliniella panamensis]
MFMFMIYFIEIMLKKMIFLTFLASFFMMINSNHPMMMGILIIIQSIFVAINLSLNLNFNWFSYMLFMIYLGGILMLFSYIISISFSKQPLLKVNPIFFMIILLTVFYTQNESFLEFKKMKISKLLIALYNINNKLTLFLMAFLFFIMTSVIFITENEKMSLKKK